MKFKEKVIITSITGGSVVLAAVITALLTAPIQEKPTSTYESSNFFYDCSFTSLEINQGNIKTNAENDTPNNNGRPRFVKMEYSLGYDNRTVANPVYTYEE